jgi:hypothetical protein
MDKGMRAVLRNNARKARSKKHKRNKNLKVKHTSLLYATYLFVFLISRIKYVLNTQILVLLVLQLLIIQVTMTIITIIILKIMTTMKILMIFDALNYLKNQDLLKILEANHPQNQVMTVNNLKINKENMVGLIHQVTRVNQLIMRKNMFTDQMTLYTMVVK